MWLTLQVSMTNLFPITHLVTYVRSHIKNQISLCYERICYLIMS